MKKLLVAMLAVLVVFSFVGCSGDDNKGNGTADNSMGETGDGADGQSGGNVVGKQENIDYNNFTLTDEQEPLIPGDSKVDFVDHEIISASTSSPDHQRVIDYYLALAEEMGVRGTVITEESQNPEIEYWVYEGLYGVDDTLFSVYIATNSEATTATVNY